ncbi:MAG: IS110 family transposase, partial [Bdellovibrionales bacterium]
MLNENTPACHPFWVGVDVGKETLAIHIAASNTALTLPNKAAAIKAFLAQNPQATLVLESTGGYETAAITLALKAGHTVYRVNARRVRAFMESVGVYAKTDAIDAKALADFAITNVRYLHPFALPTPEMKKLRQLARRRDELIAMRTQETNRLKAPDNSCLLPSIKAVLKCLKSQIEAVEGQLAQLTENTQGLQEKIAVLTDVKGVGKVTAVNLLVAMPELGQLTGKQVASLAGLAPFPRDSGKKKGYRRTRGGRVEVRRALYMAALSAARYHDDIKVFYLRLITNGKRPLQALIAVARKLLVILNAKL